jgi:hypothetical protein
VNVELAIVDITTRGVAVTLADGRPFWLPRSAPGLEWSATPEIGTVAWVRLPRWLISKHKQLSEYAYQRSLALYAPVEIDAGKPQGALPIAYDNNLTGALFKNNKRENDRHPLYRGSCEINGQKFWISAWLKTSERTGEKFMSLAFKPAEEQRQEQQRTPEQNTYATARGREEPQHQQRPAGGQSFADSDIPFGPDR